MRSYLGMQLLYKRTIRSTFEFVVDKVSISSTVGKQENCHWWGE